MTQEELDEFDRNCAAALEHLRALGVPAAGLVTLVEETVINQFRGHPRGEEFIPVLRQAFERARRRVAEGEAD